MARRRSTINTVDLTRALKALRAAGIMVHSTTIAADGSVTILHDTPLNLNASPEDALFRWETARNNPGAR